MTLGEFRAWLGGVLDRNDWHVPRLLRLMAYQSITLNPYIDSGSKPYDVYDYYLLYGERNERLERLKQLQYIDPKQLAERWLAK